MVARDRCLDTTARKKKLRPSGGTSTILTEFFFSCYWQGGKKSSRVHFSPLSTRSPPLGRQIRPSAAQGRKGARNQSVRGLGPFP